MATRALIGVKSDEKIICSYLHYDGYPQHTGTTLLENFDSVLNAAWISNYGVIKSVKRNVITPFDSDEELMQRPSKIDLTDIERHAERTGAEWIYLYDLDARAWLFSPPHDICFVPLTEEAIKEWEW